MSKGNRFTEEFKLEAVKQVVERGFGLLSHLTIGTTPNI